MFHGGVVNFSEPFKTYENKHTHAQKGNVNSCQSHLTRAPRRHPNHFLPTSGRGHGRCQVERSQTSSVEKWEERRKKEKIIIKKKVQRENIRNDAGKPEKGKTWCLVTVKIYSFNISHYKYLKIMHIVINSWLQTIK